MLDWNSFEVSAATEPHPEPGGTSGASSKGSWGRSPGLTVASMDPYSARMGSMPPAINWSTVLWYLWSSAGNGSEYCLLPQCFEMLCHAYPWFYWRKAFLQLTSPSNLFSEAHRIGGATQRAEGDGAGWRGRKQQLSTQKEVDKGGGRRKQCRVITVQVLCRAKELSLQPGSSKEKLMGIVSFLMEVHTEGVEFGFRLLGILAEFYCFPDRHGQITLLLYAYMSSAARWCQQQYPLHS